MKHFVYGAGAAYVGTFVFTLGLAVGMEFKDKMYGNKWDWLDLIATVLGGLIGQVLQIFTLNLIF